jgi:outer membrane immunogenic protein
MTRLTASTLAALLYTTGLAIAGGVAEPSQPHAVITPPEPVADDAFEGFYVGLAFGHVGGDGREEGGANNGPFDIDRDSAFGAFGGYNHQNGNLVLGAELAAWPVDTTISDGSTFELNRLTDLRGRVGWATGDVLVYGALGWSWARTENTVTGSEVDHDGHNLGRGVEYNITETLFLGLDYTTRGLDGEERGVEYDMDVNTLSLRGGFRF